MHAGSMFEFAIRAGGSMFEFSLPAETRFGNCFQGTGA